MSDQVEPNPSSTPPPPKKFRYQQAGTIDHLYLATKLADVYFTFTTPKNTRIPAHKTLLAANSEVFETMFYGESEENGEITISDASDAVFKEFLQFFYLSEIELTIENIAGVFELGQKYNVRKCIDACIQILKKDLTDENVCVILEHAINCAPNDVTKICERHIIINAATVFKSAAFLECSKDTLEYILKINLLFCSEVDIFEACMAWVQAKNQQKTVSKVMVQRHLGDLYYEIRFASMTMQEFCQLSSKYNQVLSKDFETITRIIVETEPQSSKFNTSPRRTEWNADEIVECDRALSDARTSITFDNKSETTFSSNQLLILGQFTCDKIGYKGLTRPYLPVDVEIKEFSDWNGANTKSLLQMKMQIKSTETNILLLQQPVLIRPGFFYTICMESFPTGCWYDSKELKKEVMLDADTKIEFHNDYVAAKDKKIIGLISVLHFNRV